MKDRIKIMRITKSSAAEIVGKLSPRARHALICMFIHKQTLTCKSKKDFGQLITELVCAKVIRSDWNILSNEAIFVLERGGQMVVDVIKDQIKASKEISPNGNVKN